MSEPEPVDYVVAERPSYRDLYDEVAALRQELAEASAERDRYRQHSVSLNTVGYLLADALAGHAGDEQYVGSPEAQAKRVIAERDAIREAATRVVQLVTHGADGLVVGEAIAEMRRVLDGGGR
jgi:hypothetical protein